MTLLVRDEEDIIASNIDFHLSRGVDHFLVMDNRSQDATAHILRGYQDQGLVTYIFQPQDDYSQGVWVTQMAQRACREMNADWVINNDADEFWWPQSGSLKDVLAAIPGDAEAVRVERSNFIPVADRHGQSSAPAQSFAAAMTVRERQSFNALGHPLPPKLCHRGFPDVVVGQGNHDATLDGRQLVAISAPISILHYPVRTYDQLSNKIAKGGAAYQRNTVLPEEVGGTWRWLHALQTQGDLRATYDALALSEAEIAEGLASGRLLRDERLRDALAALAQT
jgi:Glycosyl transferase family 2